MHSTINSRAKQTSNLKRFCQKHNLSHRTILSINPKTEKSLETTRILHFAPSTISGVNVCAGSGNCEKICLHFSGIPFLMGGKKTARIIRTLAFFDDPQSFLELIATAVLYNRSKLEDSEILAMRMNGTSDIPFETIKFSVSEELSRYWKIKFGHYIVPTEYESIIHLFSHYPELLVKFYDYTKIRRNWTECKRIGYHLTFSFDGWNNAANLKLCREAISHGVNVAAAFDIKRGKELPYYVDAARFYGQDSDSDGGVLYVQDGDLSDYRPNDTHGGENGGSIIGLRFKLPHGVDYTAEEKAAFCIA